MPADPANPKLSMEGEGALLLDAAGPTFSDEVQQRVWAVAVRLRSIDGVRETVPGMNNLMVVFDALQLDPDLFERRLLGLWQETPPQGIAGRRIEIPVHYGGVGGEDLADLARAKNMTPEALVERHAGVEYSVAAVGAMPGFVYLSGLDPLLAAPRRAVPRMAVPVGSVIIGGAQAGIMPVTAPSGWHIIGHTPVRLFDAAATEPVLCRPGDTLIFRIEGISA